VNDGSPAAASRPGRLQAVIALVGPTGVGKSSWAMRLAADLPVEIVSVDSAQVYRGMDIGTAKPTADERARVPHHLLDLRDPVERYSAGEFSRDARAAIDSIQARGRIPLLVGGTMLYLRALYRGMAALPPANPQVRAQLEEQAARIGWPALHERLRELDPEAAGRIHPNDPQRIQRALEVHRLTGRSLSSWQSATTGAEGSYRWLRHALWPADRASHAAALAARFDAMLAAGLRDEVRALHARPDLDPSLPSIRSVGYRQLWEWCAGRTDFEQARERAIVATRQLSKRQMTWLRAESGIEPWSGADSTEFNKFRKKLQWQLDYAGDAPAAAC
jgi:tRNA dimethylallyltransferase